MSEPKRTSAAGQAGAGAVRSFDFYDTLVTRMVPEPRVIFDLVEEAESIPGFAAMRIEGERRARRKHGVEVNFQEIYAELPLDDETRARAMRCELALERSLLVAIRENSDAFSDGDLILSDMYFEGEQIDEIWSALGSGRRPGAIYVSGDHRATKASGRLWEIVTERHPEMAGHIGDHAAGDVRQPRRRGIAATHYRAASLNRYERYLAAGSLDDRVLAGVSKATRLGLIGEESSPRDRAIVNSFASVFAPVVVGFVDWVGAHCRTAGISHVLFLARDGLAPFKVAERLFPQRYPELSPRYVYGSRHALHAPGFTTIERAEPWLLAPVGQRQLTLREIAARGKVDPEVASQITADLDLPSLDDALPARDVDAARRFVRDPRFVAALVAEAERSLPATAAYYRAAGLDTGAKVALVDIGWTGGMQASLASLLERAGHAPAELHGLYLVLKSRAHATRPDPSLGYLQDPDHRGPRFEQWGGVLEASLSAEHPTTLSFEPGSDGPEPRFGAPLEPRVADWNRLQHLVYETFAENLVQAERAVGRPIAVDRARVSRNLVRFLSSPTPLDAATFAEVGWYVGQVEIELETIATRVRLRDVVTERSRLGMWQAGSLALSGLRALNPLLHVAKSAVWARRRRRQARPGRTAVPRSRG